MVEITLVRHGQANTGAKDEASYDKLSDLGRQQAAWLGTHFADLDERFDLVVSGTMQRQHDTARAITAALGGDVLQDARLNEMDYFGLSKSLEDSQAVAMPTDRDSFITHIPQVFNAWESGAICSHLESFVAFETRVHEMIALAEQRGGRVLFVTSGGVIGMVMRVLLGLEVTRFASVLLQIRNTSVHRYVKQGDGLVLDTFNAVPHLERADRLEARTMI